MQSSATQSLSPFAVMDSIVTDDTDLQLVGAISPYANHDFVVLN
jgi:hypothetical protein